MLKRFVTKLPVYHQTETQKQFFAATFDQLFNPANVEQIQGFVGRRSGDILDYQNDIYLSEPSKNRRNYQLEPISYTKDSLTLEDSNHVFYEDLLNKLKFHGGDITNHDRLFSDTYYSFAPPIDIDKFINYGNYVWIEDEIPPVYFAYTGTPAAFDLIIENQIIGQEQFNTNDAGGMSPLNFQFSNGLRVVFEGSNNYTSVYTVEGVGTSIRLVPPQLTQVPGALAGSTPWDFGGLLEWDSLPWDSAEVVDIPPLKDHITIERGTCDGNAWSRTNRWYHIDVITDVQNIGQIIGATLIDGGIGYTVGDILNIDGDGMGGQIEVTGVDGFGTITDFIISSRGQGYSFATLDDTGATPLLGTVPWDQFPGGSGSLWDDFAWDEELVPSSGTDAIFDIELAIAIDRSNRGQRPIVEYKRHIELYNHGTRFLQQVDLVAATDSIGDIVGQSTYSVDGIPLSDGTLLIFLNPSTIPSFLPWDENPNAGPGSMSLWDSGPWDVQGAPGSITRFVWEVSGVGTSIELTPVGPAAELGDSVLVRSGFTYSGYPFYQVEDPILGQTWTQGQTKTRPNTHPKFRLYDYQGIPLDDELEYPFSTFSGNEIFSYRIYQGEALDENEFANIDRVLNFETVRKNLGQVTDLVFENDLETVRSEYRPTGDSSEEIPGYYFYRELDYNEECVVVDGSFHTNWRESTTIEKQRVVDQFITATDNETIFTLTATPVNEDVYVEVNGTRLGDDQYEYDSVENAVELFVSLSAGTIVETFTYTHDSITDQDFGFFEIPSGLENNPNNLEVIDHSWNEFASHFLSIIENQTPFFGQAFGVSNNYRDSKKDNSVGRYILQNQASLLKAMLMVSGEELDLIESIRLSSREYTRFKNKFLKTGLQLIAEGYTPFNAGDAIPVNQWVDEVIRRIILTREFPRAFEDTHMIAWTNVYEEEELVGDSVSTTLTVSNFIDLTLKNNAMYIYKNGGLLLADVDYAVVNLNPIMINFTTPPLVGDDVLVRLYEGIAPAHIPATPAKLGMDLVHEPRIELDETYRDPTEVIVGHDGSRTPVYNDYRDELLLEFEKRIYNGILSKFRGEYNLAVRIEDIEPTVFRTTRWNRSEYEAILRQSFYKWTTSINADHRVNDVFDVGDEWTWNYSSLLDKNGDPLPGYWRGIFDTYYGSQTPHITPWEMLGFVTQPDWWVNTLPEDDTFTGYGSGPWPANHPMWQDIEAGIIRRGSRAGTDERFARPGLVALYLPVDNSGSLKATPLDCIGYIGPLPTLDQASSEWTYGDLSPVEYAWRTSEAYSFAVSELLFLTRPGSYGEKFWNPENFLITPANDKQVVSLRDNVLKRVGNDVQTVHGETRGGELVLNTGYQVWVSSRLKMLGLNISREFGDKVRGLDVKLGHKMAGFTNSDSLRLFVEGISSTATTTSLLLPTENINVRLFTGPAVRTYFYGGVVIKATETGRYRVYGYDILKNSFTYYTRRQSNEDRAINVAGEPEAFTSYENGRTYSEGTIVRLNGQFYRATTTHLAERFIPDNWNRLSSLPIRGGVSVTYRPKSSGVTKSIDYGHEFATVQEVFDFLIGWGDYLTSDGWQFENVNVENNTIENWLSAGKEFLFWVGTQWQAGSAIILSPSANKTELVVQEGYPQSVEKISNGVYSILDKNGFAIDPINTKVIREDRKIQVVPLLEGQDVFSLRVSTAETENIITIDNVTEFNDVVYDPLLGSRQARVFLNGLRTKDWTGKLEAAGYIITQENTIPNLENIVNSVRNYHNTEVLLDDQNIETVARHLTGYTERDYLTNLQLFDDAQYQFYHGTIRQKGTTQSIDKLERSRIVTDLEDTLEVYEEWALRVGDFGGTENDQMVEFFLPANAIKVDPQLVELVYPQSKKMLGVSSKASVASIEIVSSGNVWSSPPNVQIFTNPADTGGSGATAESILNDDGTLKEIVVTNGGSGYSLPPRVSIGPVTPTAFSDRAVAVLEFEITPDVAGDDIITIDIDDTDAWVTKPTQVPSTNRRELWPETDYTVGNTPNAGYVHLDDITHTIFDIEDLQDLWDRPAPPQEASLIWTAKAENKDWAVYKMYQSSDVVRQFHVNDTPEFALTGASSINIVDAGTLYTVGEEIEVFGGPGQRAPFTVRVTDVDTGGEVLAVEIVDGGIFYDTTLPWSTALGGGGASITLTEVEPINYEEGRVVLTTLLPESDTNSLRHLRGKVVIDGVVYSYEQEVADIYRLSVDGEPIEDGVLNDADGVADLQSVYSLYNLRFRNSDEWNAEQDFAIVGTAATDKIWLDTNARSAVYEILGITSGEIIDSFFIVDGGFGYTESGQIEVEYGGGTGGILSYTVNPSTRSVTSISLVSAGTGYPDNVTPPDPPAFQIILNLPPPQTGDGKWRVYNVQGTNLEMHRIQERLIDTSRFEAGYVYDVSTKDTLVQLPIYDPFKGIIPGIADKNIRYKAAHDPAKYTDASELRLINAGLAFGASHVGELWWDTSTAAYIWYEQGDDLYRRDNWGTFFPGSSVDIYEWVREAVPPSEYDGAGTVKNITDFVRRREWDPLLEEFRTFYYYWVKDLIADPGTFGRTLSSSEVARIIRNPSSQLYRWYSPISQSGFVFSGVDGVFTDSDNIFQINYTRTQDDNKKHVEWELGRELDPHYRLNTKLWNKLVDSLVGFTQPVPINSSNIPGFPPLRNYNDALPVAGNTSMGYLPVPDLALGELNRVGIRQRPRQTMFSNRSEALRVLVEVVNRIVYDFMLRDQDPNWNASLQTNNLWEWADWYAEGYNQFNVVPSRQVATLGELASITPTSGEIVKVSNTRPSYHVYDFENEQWTMIAKRDVRMMMTDRIYTVPQNLQDSLELRAILDALYNRIFTGFRTIHRNELFFAMLNYVFQEQEDIDWAFKTTFVVVDQTGKRVGQDRVFQADPFDNVIKYIEEVKPYQTKVREYRITRALEVDDLLGSITELDRDMSVRMFFDRFRCSLSLAEVRIAKAEGRNNVRYDGYSTLDGGATLVRLGAAGRFVLQQTDLLDDILDVIGGDSLSDYTPVNAYWDTIEWDTEGWDGAAGTNAAELGAVAEINRRLHEEFRCYFEGLLINNIDLTGTQTTQPWDSVPWDLVGWDSNSEDDSIGTLEGANLDNVDTFYPIDPEDSFVANGIQKEFNLTTTAPSYFLFVRVFDDEGNEVPSPVLDNQPYTLNVDYFFIGGRIVFMTPPAVDNVINVYTYVEAGDFINPQVHAGVTEEMLPLDPRENLVIVADTVDDPETPTVSYSFRIHYDTQKGVTYMRNAAVSMTTLAADIGPDDHTIAVDDVSMLEDASYENPQVAWICMERIVYHGKDNTQNLLLGVQRGTRGTSRVAHLEDCKIFGFDGHEISKAAAEQYWISPSATDVYNGVAGQWRDNADGTAIFSDTAASAFAANSDPGDGLRILSGTIAGSFHIVDQIAVGSLSTVTITTPGEGYAVGDAITITGAGTGTAIVGAIGPNGSVAAVTITDPGTGYGAGPETMTSAAGDSTFEATVVTNREALVIAHTAPKWSGSGRVVEVDGVEWRIDTANPGGLLASTTAAATFMLAEQGDALPCCPGPAT